MNKKSIIGGIIAAAVIITIISAVAYQQPQKVENIPTAPAVLNQNVTIPAPEKPSHNSYKIDLNEAVGVKSK